MISTEKEEYPGNNSTHTPPTNTSRKPVSYKKFALERDAKNCAYAFIISRNQMDAFRLWRETTQRRDHLYIIADYQLRENNKNI